MANRILRNWAHLPEDMKENVYFETWMGRLPFPDSEAEKLPSGKDPDEVKRLYVSLLRMLVSHGVMADLLSSLRRDT